MQQHISQEIDIHLSVSVTVFAIFSFYLFKNARRLVLIWPRLRAQVEAAEQQVQALESQVRCHLEEAEREHAEKQALREVCGVQQWVRK